MPKMENTSVPVITRSEVDRITVAELRKLIELQPLLEVNASKEGVANIELYRGDSIYFGTGICSHKEISSGTPLDILSMVLTAASLRKKLGLKSIYHNIADSNAETNNFPAEAIEKMTLHYENTIQRITKKLGIADYNVVRASVFNAESAYKEILTELEQKEELSKLHRYALQEIADIEFFRRKGATLKLGWTMSIKNSQYDESFYDSNFRKYVNAKVGFIYITPGRSFDKSKPRVAPYVDFNPSQRIMIPDNLAAQKLDAAQAALGVGLQGIEKYYKNILKLWREFDENLPKGSVKEGVQYVLDALK
jgi:hypothetical protein